MLKWAVIVAAVTGLGLTLSINQLIATKADLRVSKIQAAQAEGQLNALQERYQRAALVRQSGENHRVQVRNESNKTEWGAMSVPADVTRVLCERANCAGREVSPSGN